MDELEAAMKGVMRADHEHPRFSSYKSAGYAEGAQQRRREAVLSQRSDEREARRNRLRRLTRFGEEDEDLDLKEDENLETGMQTAAGEGGSNEKDKQEEPMDLHKPAAARGRNQKRNHPKQARVWDGQLMTSEWLVDIPASLGVEWIAVLCPIGKRVLVVATGGITTLYNKSGHVVDQFPSRLPAGGHGKSSGATILDAIWDSAHRRVYCLDVLRWGRALELVDSPFDCRLFCLRSRFEEQDPLLSEPDKFMAPTFHLAPTSVSCEKGALEKLLTEEVPEDGKFELDGVLFYHSQVVYTPGQSPLVGWLKPWMLPEVLGVEVPGKYVPPSSAAQFIRDYNERSGHRSKVGVNADLQDEKSGREEAVDE